MSADEKKGKSLTLEEKDRLVDEMRHSGLTQQAWSDERGIHLRTLRHWIHERNLRERSPQPVKWLAVSEKPQATRTETAVYGVLDSTVALSFRTTGRNGASSRS